MNTDKLINPYDFASVTTSKFEDQGTKRGHFVYVAALKALPEKEEDPYLQRIYALVHKVTKDGHTLPDDGLYLMDPRDLSRVRKGRQERFTQILKDDFEIQEIEEAVEEQATATAH